MPATHLKRKIAPRTWPILRKQTVFITRPRPKGHPIELSLPIVVVLREMLGIAQTKRQAQGILKSHEVTVNGRRVWHTDDAVGFMDVLGINEESYRLTINENELLELLKVKKGEEFSVQKIAGKTVLKGKKIQLNCASGMNLLAEKDQYKVGDSITVKDGRIGQHLPLKEQATVLITGGRHVGKRGSVESMGHSMITIKSGNDTLQTASRYAYVVGEKKPAFE